MIERRRDWPEIRSTVEEVLRDIDPTFLPPFSLVEDVLHDRYLARDLKISREDVLYATACLAHLAEFYVDNLRRESLRVAESEARERLARIARITHELVRELMLLDAVDRTMARKVLEEEGQELPDCTDDVSALLDTVILARSGDPAAQILIEPLTKDQDANAILAMGLAIANRRLGSERIDYLSRIWLAADHASNMPLGQQELPVWRMLRSPKLTLRAIECVVDEMASMFGMLLGEILSGSRDRDRRDGGPLIGALRLFFGWIEEQTGNPPPSPSTLETAARRVFVVPTSFVSSRFLRRP